MLDDAQKHVARVFGFKTWSLCFRRGKSAVIIARILKRIPTMSHDVVTLIVTGKARKDGNAAAHPPWTKREGQRAVQSLKNSKDRKAFQQIIDLLFP